MSRIIVREGPGRGTVYELVDDRVTIGRDPTNTIQIPSETVSRAHAVLTHKRDESGDTWEIRDQNSKNGIQVNGRRVAAAPLNSGDEINLGVCVLTFIEREFDTLESGDLVESGTVLRMRDTIRTDAVGAGPDTTSRMGALLEVGRRAAAAETFSSLFTAITEAITQHLSPHRTVPILFDERKGMLRPWVAQRGEFDKHLAKLPISSTIVTYVREHREAILSESARKDERLKGARSIAANEISSAMCAPIILGDRLLGAIYADRLGDAEPFTKADLEMLTAFAAQSAVAVENVRMREEVGRERYLREKEARGAYDIIGSCEAIQQVFRFIAKAAPTEAGVLIEGESGTGKELVARAIHLNSRRRHQPFEAVNCAAMAPTLLESELFGHVKGAFTGADRDRPGRFELADGGTLFLDEIGELPDSSQSKLLRVIETGELRRVGDVKDRKVDVRVVAATNKRLADEKAAHRFRDDLYFRLNVLHVHIPPLRERPGDITLLAEHFLAQFASKCGRPKLAYEPGVLEAFNAYPWPGNVRELKNAVERMVVMADEDVLKADEVPYEIRSQLAGGATPGATAPAVPEALVPLRDVERDYIVRVLRMTGGNKKEAARVLGIDRSTLYAKIKAYGLESKEEP